MKTAVIACAAAALLLAGAAAEEPRTPGQWVAQLGADNLQDREAASTALLGLGAKARDAVHQGLDSKDPEVQARARELWKTLRWLVIPDADEDIHNLVAEAEKGSIDESHWKDFVQKHGAESLRLVAAFRVEAMHKAASGQDNGNGQPEVATDNFIGRPVFDNNNGRNLYQPGLRAVMENVPPMDVARVIAQTDNANDRKDLNALLDESAQPDVPEKSAVRWMEIEIALWNYEKAYDFGREYSIRTASADVAKECAIAVDRGTLFEKIHDAAKKDILSEADAGRLCAKLGFYTGLFSALEKKPLIGPLFDLLPNGDTAGADDASLRRVVESLLNAGMPDRAVKVLHNVQSAEGLYMRSAADAQTQNQPVADADWSDAMSALDAVDDSKKKEAYYDLGELMRDWHDQRAVVLWQKVLSISPADTVYDANTCFRMGEFLEARRQFAQAAAFYERGAAIASKVGGVMIATTPDGKSAGMGNEPVLEKIRQLKAEAAEQKSMFNNPPATGGGNDGPE